MAFINAAGLVQLVAGHFVRRGREGPPRRPCPRPFATAEPPLYLPRGRRNRGADAYSWLR